MRTVVVVTALSVLARAVSGQSGPMINTPPAYVQCQPVSITFSGGTAPYYLSVIPGGQASAAALEDLPTQTAAGSYTWTVNIAAGTNITLRITDANGSVNYNAPRVIQASSDSSCLGSTPSSGGSSGASSAPPATATSAGTSTLVSASASATVTAASGSAVPTTNGTVNTGTFNFSCPQGLLTYGITNTVLPGVSLKQATGYFGNWTGDAPGTPVKSSGTGTNAQRSWSFGGNITLSEKLLLNQTNSSTGALHQQWNFTSATPVTLVPGASGLTVYDAFNDLQIYSNATNNATSLQYFILACFNNQTLGLEALAELIQFSVGSWAGNLSSSAPPARVRRTIELF